MNNNIYKKLFLSALVSFGILGIQKANAQTDSLYHPKIGSFVSVQPIPQAQTIAMPKTHTFQLIAKSGTTSYSNGSGTLGGNNDFTAYLGKSGSSKAGYVAVNHETTPGGVSILDLSLNESTMLWETNEVRKVDFSPVVKTVRNCSGGITPWGTVITSEETFSLGDANLDGYQDVGWNVEIDPVTGLIRDYDGDGKPDKLWALGRMSHENIAVSADGMIAYETEDGGTGGVYKFVANTYGNLSEGTLYVLKLDSIGASTGTWIQVPNTSPVDGIPQMRWQLQLAEPTGEVRRISSSVLMEKCILLLKEMVSFGDLKMME